MIKHNIKNRLVTVLVIGLALLSMAGTCVPAGTSSGNSGGGRKKFNSARNLYQAALAAARAQDPGAQLIGVQGIEATDPEEFLTEFNRIPPKGDSEVLHYAAVNLSVPTGDPFNGDGRASAWIFTFIGPTGERAIVVNTRRRTIAFNQIITNTLPLPDGAAIETWQIDSDTMTDLATASVPAYRQLRGQRGVAVHDLTFKSGRAIWITSLLSGPIADRDFELADVMIDAATGALISPGRLFGRDDPK